jgi:hypothetical protein
MTVAVGEVVPTPSEIKPYKVVISYGSDILAEWPCDSYEEGNRLLIEALRGLGELAKKKGHA